MLIIVSTFLAAEPIQYVLDNQLPLVN